MNSSSATAAPSSPSFPSSTFVVRPDDAIDVSALRRVLVIMLRHHGDVLLTTPVYSVLKAAAPHAEVDALIYSETLPMLEFNPNLAGVHTIDKRWKKAGLGAQLASEWQLLSALKARRYDLVIHLTNHRRGAWLARLLSPRWSIAPKLRKPARFWSNSFSHLYPNSSSVGSGSPLGRRHVVEQNLDSLRRLGIAIAHAPGLTMVPGPAGERDADRFLQENRVGRDYIVLQPTSRWLFKCWSVERNAELVRALLGRGETIVLSCAPDPREQAMVTAIVEQIRSVDDAAFPPPSGEGRGRDGDFEPYAAIPASGSGLQAGTRTASEGIRPQEHPAASLAPHLPIPENLKLADDGGTLNRLAALIGRAKLFIGIDSAPMHIAAAMGTPSVALFGPSSEFSWGPWHGGDSRRKSTRSGVITSRVITSNLHPCRPCGQDGCGGGKISECLTRLPVARVLDAVDELLHERPARSFPASFLVS